MRAVVVGFGSIGERHARILGELGHDVALVTRRAAPAAYATIADAVRAHRPEYVVIANETAAHLDAMRQLVDCGYQGAVLMEKPLFHASLPAPAHRFAAFFVAFNLRFHPLVQRLRAIGTRERIVCAVIYVGQHLATWRKRDYRQGYSADRDRGGGVLLDLSHEIDYVLWTLGGWRALTASGGRVGNLDATSDDAFSIVLRCGKCELVSIDMNYLHRPGKRTISLISERATYELDLQHGSITTDGGPPEAVPMELDATYREQHLALLEGRHDQLCTLEQAQDVMRAIDAAQRASRDMAWIRNP
jgi:predicted dehydrogenase